FLRLPRLHLLLSHISAPFSKLIISALLKHFLCLNYKSSNLSAFFVYLINNAKDVSMYLLWQRGISLPATASVSCCCCCCCCFFFSSCVKPNVITRNHTSSCSSAPPASSLKSYLCSLLETNHICPAETLSLPQLQKLESIRLLRLSDQQCKRCQHVLTLHSKLSNINGATLRCSFSRCRYYYSITNQSFFESYRESVTTILYILVLLDLKLNFKAIAQLANVDAQTIYKIYGAITDRMHAYNESHSPKFITGDIVKLDETKIKWRKGHLHGEWVLGAVNREYNKCWLTVIE